MPTKVHAVPPTGRLSAKEREFAQIVYDMRHVVFSVLRERQMPNGMRGAVALGTGFFVARDIFITCDHVMNNPSDPHQNGDSYILVANLGGTSGNLYRITNPQLGNEVNLFPNLDLAVLRVNTAATNQPFAALEYGEVYEGEDIGVTGDLLKRIFEHKWKELDGFSSRYNCDRLVWFESHQIVTAAIAREKQRKGGRREKKIALIEK